MMASRYLSEVVVAMAIEMQLFVSRLLFLGRTTDINCKILEISELDQT